MTNAAAIGYMIIAAKRLEIDPKLISALELSMRAAMDSKTEEEAEEVYRKS